MFGRLCYIIKNYLKLYLVFLFVLFISSNLALEVSAEESLTISNWQVDSKIMDNGDLEIVEDITFEFNEYFNGVFREIILEGTDGIDNIHVSELVENKEVNYNLDTDAEKGDTNVYLLDEDDDSVNIQIFSPSEEEQKTFRIKYVVKNVSVKYNDIGELYYKFLGDENSTSIGFFEVNIELAGTITDKTKIYAHGPSNGIINFSKDNTIKAEVENVPQDTYVELRVVFPTEFISSSSNLVKEDGYDKIVEEELSYIQEIENKAIKREERKEQFNYISIMLTIVLLLAMAIIYGKSRRKVSMYDIANSKIDDNSPAIVDRVINGVVSSNSLMATIYDLARRGYLSIEDEENSQKENENIRIIKLYKSRELLLRHEEYLMNWLFNDIGNGDFVDMKSIETYAKKSSSKFYSKYYNWTAKVKEEAKEMGYYDNSSNGAGITLLLLSIITFIVSIIALIYDSKYGIALLIISPIAFVYSIVLLVRKTDYGYIQTKKWVDFKKEFKRRSELTDIDDLTYSLDKALIYGLVLGIGFKSLKNFETVMPKEVITASSNYWMYWYFLSDSSGKNIFEKGIDKSFKNIDASTGDFSSGGGGGFSSGGGGGAGGGGAGGF